MVEETPTIDTTEHLKKTCENIRAVARSATALFFTLALTSCTEEINNARRLSEKYSSSEPEDNVVRYMSCPYQAQLEIVPQGNKAFYTETIILPGGRSVDFILPTSDRLETIYKVRSDGQLENISPDDAITYQLFDDLAFTTHSGEDRVVDSVWLELDCGL